MRIQFFTQEDDTKIINFDEGRRIDWCYGRFFLGNGIFKICHYCLKGHNLRTDNNFP